MSEPSAANAYLADHVALLRSSFRQLTGRELLSLDAAEAEASPAAIAEALYRAPFVVLSHGTEVDPVFNYANLTAQCVFEMSWAEITQLPSRFSAEPVSREERAQLLERVSSHGFIDDYRGVRISATGRRFWIEQATVWNVSDATGAACGQAATFAQWTPLAE
ncbi:MEKHLA domain-containing protein [Actomonas aquatica]|uniref:MEKHLA domain-containing protein n=1 Tax=Actomonas aquatica TaxID=2866162 RepID=A0ABZ1CB87_9BACT|nr:MEKHLA domain-containing protein [Opitutus sp. WL0086]WRQ87570.1 MEKHLA domain-containing protein [Opitutus sp. WL0086]